MAARSVVNKLFVANLPWTVGSRELRHYFSEFGPVSSANVVYDRNTGFSRGYGFVVFGTSEAFNSAKSAALHKLEGNTLNIRISSTGQV